MSQTRATYIKPEGASSTPYPAWINASLADLSDGPLKNKKSISIEEKDTEITKSLTCESTVLHSHLLWLTYLLLALTKRLEQPSTVPVVQPILIKVFQHQKWVQALLTDSLTTLASNAILVRRNLTISSISDQAPKDTESPKKFSSSGRFDVLYLPRGP